MHQKRRTSLLQLPLVLFLFRFEFIEESIERGFLVGDGCAAQLREEPRMTRWFLNYVLRSLITGAAQSAKVREVIGTAVAVIHDVADMQPHLPGRVQIVVIAGPRSAHLAGIAVSLQDLGAYAGRDGASESIGVVNGWFGNQFVFTGLQGAVVVVGDDRPALVVSQLPNAARPFRHVQSGGFSYLPGCDDSPYVGA